MAQTEYTGKAMTFTWNSVSFEGLTKVEINEAAGPSAEPLDATVYGDTTYTNVTDPLGAKGAPKATVTASCWASSASYADSKNTKHALNTAQTGTFDSSTVANANSYTNAALELTKRVTEIPFDGYATCVMTFESNALGTWDSPA